MMASVRHVRFTPRKQTYAPQHGMSALGQKRTFGAVCYTYKKYQIASSPPAIKTTIRMSVCRAIFEPASAITKTNSPTAAPNTHYPHSGAPFVFWPKADIPAITNRPLSALSGMRMYAAQKPMSAKGY
jgi:hypothetical protein